MSEHAQDEQHPLLDESAPPRGSALAAWCVILVVVVTVVLWQRWRTEQAAAMGRDSRLRSNVLELQGRYLVGAKAITGQRQGKALYEQAKAYDRGPFRQRLRFAVLAGELAGPREALARLKELGPPPLRDREQEEKTAAKDERLRQDLLRLYEQYASDHFDSGKILSDEEREELRSALGWFGELALAPPEAPDKAARQQVVAPARQVATGLLAGVLGGLGLALLGFIGLIVLVILLANGWVRRGFVTGSPYGAVYAETFALWLVLFVGLLWINTLLPRGPSPLFRGSVLALLSLFVALAWPVWRGVPWREVRQDVGLYAERPFREVLSGLATYVMALPLLAAGFGVMALILFALRKGGGFEDGAPAHPLVGLVTRDWWVRFQIVFAAAVEAPLVEETMFRGVFYRHLREATLGWRVALSVLVSGLVSGFVFAVVHPQGLIAVPLLMGLAMGFALGREWRGSLVSSVIAHGLHNGLLTLFFLVALT
jgi:membrane protease YdiL (CAAX protease family)